MSGDRQYGRLGPREALDVINQVFPNIGRFLRYVLKNELLSQEAESLRTRYDTLLGKLERMASPMKETSLQLQSRPISFTGDGSKLLHLQRMHCRQGTFPELQKDGKSCSGDLLEKDTPYKHNGHLLCKDPTKSRWHRYSCYVSSPEALLYFYDPADDSCLVTTVPLSGRTIVSGEAADQQTGKENSLIITRIGDGVQEYYLAAFNPEEYKSWLDTLNRVIENISLKAKRNSMPCFGNYAPDKLGLWTVVPSFDISSNGESSRDSAISSGSSSHRISWAPNGSYSPFRSRKGYDLDTEDSSTNSTLPRPPKPLPSPPIEHINSKSGDGDDITIYEDIEELQEMVDKQLKQTQAAISQMGKGKDYHKSGKSGKKRKKTKGSNMPAENNVNSSSSIVSLPLRNMMSTKSYSSGSIITPTSTLTRNKPNHSQVHLIPPERNILDRNASTYSSFLHVRGSNTRWERRWFTLQKSVLAYTRDQTDKDAQVKVLVGCKVESFKDSKRNFAMRIAQLKEPDMYLSAEDEIQFIEWLTRLQMATKVQSSFENLDNIDGSTWNIAEDSRDSMAIDSSYASSAGSCRTSIVSMDYTKRVLPDLPTTNGDSREYRALIPTEDNPSDSEFLSNLSGEGIYDVPRSVLAPYGGKIVIGNMPGIYDHPYRQFINLKEDEGVYISPNEDNEDEDIYVYPPDALNDHMLLTQEEALQSLGVYDYPKVSRASTVSSSASTYRDSSLSESTLRNSSASYVTIHESQGQSIPQFTDGASFMNGNAGNGEVKFSAGELSELMNPASRVSQAIEEGLYDRPKSLWSSTTEDLEIEPLDTMAGGIKGYLYRKERFQWTKMLCCIKNNRFECYKGNTIALKLFLPGAEVFPDQEAKRPYALKIKHPRKETTLQFAAEGEMHFKMWLSAFIKAASISVQSVNDVEQIRVVDSAMKEKWRNLEGSQMGSTKDKKRLVKASTVSTLDPADKASDDSTLQRKKRLTDRIAKGMFSGKRKKKSSDHTRAETRSPVSPKPSHSNEDLLASSDTEPVEGAMKRSLSLDTVIATHSPINSPKHKSLKQKKAAEEKNMLDIPTSNASYLLVQQTRMQGAQAWVRYWSVLDNLVINFYPSRMDVGSHFKIGLRGSRVSRATQETQRPLSFMIWHLDSGNRVFCVAENETEFISWFEILTNGSEHVVPSIQDNIRRSASFYYFPSDYTLKVENQSNQSDQLSGSEHTLTVSQDHLSSWYSLNSSQENVDFGGSTNSLSSLGSAVQYAGILKHKNSSDNWVEYNCMIRKSSLYMFKNPTDKTPVTAVVLPKCQVAKIEDPTEEHVFTVLEYESKTPHVFATPFGSELPHWLSKIQECCEDRVSLHELRRMKQWLSTEDLSDQRRKQYRSAEDLPTITSADNVHLKTMSLQRPTTKDAKNAAHTYSGFIEVLIKGSSWAIYWCTVKDGSLHMYETQQSDLPLRSVRLFKHTVQTDSTQLRRPYCLVLTYPSSSPIYISLTDNLEKQKWLQVLLRATQVDGVMPHSEKDSISSYESGNAKLSDSHGSALDQCGETPENTLERKRRRVLKQYERNMKKTHKFSKQTTDSLKREKRGLVAMKEQIAPHLEKLEGLATNGDERAQEKFVALQVKVKQINAVLPYLEKCIMKNKEAEQKTIAILEKKRDEELAALEKGSTSVDSPTEKSERDRKNSTSDLYMKVLAENGDIGENPHLSEAFAGIPETSDDVHHSVSLHEGHIDIMNSTPIKPNGPSISVENVVMNDSIIHAHDHQEQLANSLDETIIASASMMEEQAIPVVIEPQDNPEASLQTDLVSTTPVADDSSVVVGQLERSAMLNLNTESFAMEPRPRSDSNAKPPPIKPKKKKVPPPRPPRRSSSYLADGIESQYSPVSDTKQRSSVLSAGSPVAPQFPRRSGSYASELEGSPAPETRQRHSTDHSASHMTVASSPVISAGPPVATRPPRRSGSHLSDSVEFQGLPVLEAIRRKSADHNISSMTAASSPVVSAGPPVTFRPPRRSGSHMSDNIELHGSPVREIKQRQSGDHSIPAGPPVASRPRRSGSHMSDNIELQGSPVGETKRKQSVDHSASNMTVNSSPIISSGPPVAVRPPRRSGSHISDSIELQGSPVGETKQRQSNDYSNANTTAESAAIPTGTLNNRTSEYLGEDLVNVSVFSKIKAFEKT